MFTLSFFWSELKCLLRDKKHAEKAWVGVGVDREREKAIHFLLFLLFRTAPGAHESFQASGRIGAAAAGLHHSYRPARWEPRLHPTPQLTATLVP